MSDLISRQAAIDALENICRHPSQHSTYERTGNDYCSYGESEEQENE